MAERSTTFGPTVAAGLVTAAATAYAGTRAWAAASEQASGPSLVPAGYEAADAPAVTALALVVLAAWGVVLVTRGRVRRGVALLGALAALATLAVAVVTAVGARDALADSLADSLGGLGTDDAAVGWTVWPWVAIAAALLSAALSAAAVRACRSWPEMGRRYDAPAAAHADARPEDLPDDLAEADEQAIWKALDEGRDPTRLDQPDRLGRGTD